MTEENPTIAAGDSTTAPPVRQASRAKKVLARRAAQARRAAALKRATRTNRQVLSIALSIVLGGLVAAHFFFQPGAPTPPSMLTEATRTATPKVRPTPELSALPLSRPHDGGLSPLTAAPIAVAESTGRRESNVLPVIPPAAIGVPPLALPGVIEQNPATAGVVIDPVERVRTLQDLLLEEVEISFGRALGAARAAADLEADARMQALLGGGIAAEARRSDPGFAAHYLGQDTVHARVTYSQPDGSSYAGQWRDFRDHGYQPHGLGELHYGTGVYAGQFQVGRPGGVGVWERPNGRYIGEFRTGKPSGVGIETVTTKRTYLGEFRDGKPTGYGVLATPSGRRYVGHIVGGKRDGAGVEVQPDGHIERGLWVGDRLATAISPPPADLVAELEPLAAFWPESTHLTK